MSAGRTDELHGYERRDSAPRMMIVMGVAIVVLVIVVLWGSDIMQRRLEMRLPGGRGAMAGIAPETGTREIPQPASTLDELAALRAEENAWLHSYRWVARDEGIVHIPIERAMDLVVSELNKQESPTTRASSSTNAQSN